MATRRGGVERVLSKLKNSIENNNYYEAHQMYRTLYFRYLGQKKYTELQTMLFEGAVLLFSHDEVASGTDLAKLYIDTLNDEGADPLEIHFVRISKLYQLIPCDNIDKPMYLSTSLKWSSNGSAHGHPRLHQHIAYGLWQSKKYPEARQHFLQSCDGQGCGNMLVEFHLGKGFNTEYDLFIAQTVLQYLCLKKLLEAANVFKTYTKNHPSIKSEPPFSHPLLNFLWLLLLAIKTSQNLTAYTLLCEKYKQFIDRDPQYLEYLDKIGQNYFGIPPPVRAKPGGMFSGLFDSLLNAMNDDSEDDDQGPGPSGGPSGAQASSSSSSKIKKMEQEDLD